MAIKRTLPVLVLLGACSGITLAATVSGRVEITDKGDVRRKDLSQVAIWLDPTPGRPAPPPAPPGRYGMTMRDKKFQPPLLIVPVGSEVEFPNLDPFFHNVFSLAPENRFDLGLYRSGKSKSTIFRKPGLVRVYCNIHSHMVGYILTVATPHFTTTTPDGLFAIPNVPPGSYVVNWWEEKSGSGSRPLTIANTDSDPLVLSLDARGYKQKPHLNKFGQEYSEDDGERY